MNYPRKKIIISFKHNPLRELLLVKKLVENENYEVDGCVFLHRYALEVKGLIKKHDIPLHNLYDFVEFSSSTKIQKEPLDVLCNFEEEFNLSISDLIYADKSFVGLKLSEKLNRLVRLMMFYDKINLESYDYSIQEMSSAADLIMYKILKTKDKLPIFFWHGRFKDRIEFSDLDGKRHGLNELYQGYKRFGKYTAIQNRLYNNIISNLEVPDYMAFATNHRPFLDIINNLPSNFDTVKSYFVDRKYAVDSNKTIKDKINNINRLFYKLRLNAISDDFEKIKNKNYIVYPEQFEPEASTATYSTTYPSQLVAIEMIRRNLPLSYPLVIKLHPSMDINRNRHFIKKIRELDYVFITRRNNFEVMRNSKALITLTSTMGWEGILLDKPVFVLGKVFYGEFDYIYNLNDIRQLRKISSLLRNWIKIINGTAYQRNKKAFVLASYYSLKKGNMNSDKDPEIVKENNITTIFESILNYIKEKENDNR